MAHQGSTKPWRGLPLRPVATFGGMLFFISVVASYPRISVSRSSDATTITYRHLQSLAAKPPPSDPGLIISSDPNHKTTPPGHKTRENMAKEWIFDTGATTHVCCDFSLMHNTTSFAYSRLAQAVGHFGPNPVPVRGMGDVTFTLPPASATAVPAPAIGPSSMLLSTIRRTSKPSTEDTSVEGGVKVNRMTVTNVSYMPESGVNIISWSQLKRAKGGLQMALREPTQFQGIEVWDEGSNQKLMTFRLRDGLYFLDHLSMRGRSDEDG